MDEAVSGRPAPVRRKPVADKRLRSLQNLAHPRIDPRPVAPVPPVRRRPEDRPVIPDKPFKAFGKLPSGDMKMGARGNPAELPERFDQIIIGIRLCTFQPLEHHQMARCQSGGSVALDQRPVTPCKRSRRRHTAVAVQRRHPGKFAFYGAARMVAFAVKPQNRPVPASRLNKIGGVLRQVDQLQTRALRHVPERKSRSSQISKGRQLVSI